MPATVTYTCDRDGVQAPSESARPPSGWSTVSCSNSNSTGGVQTARLVLCPACTEAWEEWLGKPLFAPPARTVPTET